MVKSMTKKLDSIKLKISKALMLLVNTCKQYMPINIVYHFSLFHFQLKSQNVCFSQFLPCMHDLYTNCTTLRFFGALSG